MPDTNNKHSEDGSSLKIALINARGLMSRLDRVNEWWKTTLCDVLIITETWLKIGGAIPRIADASIAVDARCEISEGGSRGIGGIMIIVRNGLGYRVIQSGINVSTIAIGKLRIIGCYFPPYYGHESRASETLFRQRWKQLEGEALLHSETIILGDFNAHGLQGDKPNTRGSWLVKQLKGSAVQRLTPSKGKWTTINSTGKGINDHVFTSKTTRSCPTLTVDEAQSFGGSDHRLLEVTLQRPKEAAVEYVERYNLLKLKTKAESFAKLTLSKLGSEPLRSSTKTVDTWVRDKVMTTDKEREAIIEEAWKILKGAVETSLGDTCGKYRVAPTERQHFLTKRMDERRAEWEQAIKEAQEATIADAPKETLRRLWRIVGDHSKWWSQRIKRRRTVVFSKVIDTLHTNTTQFQKMISCIKKKEAKAKGKSKLDVEEMSEHEKYFQSTFGGEPTGCESQFQQSTLDESDPTAARILSERLPLTEKDEAAVGKILKELPNGKAAGADGIPGEVWKALACEEQMVKVLTAFFHLCHILATTPSEWKIAHIIPIYKQKGNELNIANYRPIALTQVIRRIYEIFTNKLLTSVEEKLNKTQGGFRANRSTLDQILIVNEFLVRFKTNAVIYLDIKAAYDTVDRRILWYIMKTKFGINNDDIRIIRDLFDRNWTKLVIAGQLSAGIAILRGLLQGSSLSPKLFNMFIDSLLDALQLLPKVTIAGCLRINNAFFADDGALLVTNNIDAERLMRCCYEWSQLNGISFAIPKCQFVGSPGYEWKISMNGSPLDRVPNYKYLGVFNKWDGIDWETSTRHRTNQFKNMSSFLHGKGMNPTGWRLKQRLLTYKSFLRPMIEYGLALTILPRAPLEALQKAQNFCLKLMLHGGKSTSTAAMHLVMELETIHMRNVELNARYFNNLLNGDKQHHPVGLLVRAIYNAGAKAAAKNSLFTLFKKNSCWKEEVLTNQLPSLTDLQRLRSKNLDEYRRSRKDTTSQRLHCPQGPSKNNLIQQGWKLPRITTNAIVDYKLNKLPRNKCLICAMPVTLGHLLHCGELESASKDIASKFALNISYSPTNLPYYTDKLLWVNDDAKEPNLSIYRDIGNAILAAKKQILAPQRGQPQEYEDDEDPEEFYTAALLETGADKGFTDPPIPEAVIDSPAPPQWIQGANLRSVESYQEVEQVLNAPPQPEYEEEQDPPAPSEPSQTQQAPEAETSIENEYIASYRSRPEPFWHVGVDYTPHSIQQRYRDARLWLYLISPEYNLKEHFSYFVAENPSNALLYQEMGSVGPRLLGLTRETTILLLKILHLVRDHMDRGFQANEAGLLQEFLNEGVSSLQPRPYSGPEQ